MNNRERLAGAVLVLTLAVGILVDVLVKPDGAHRVSGGDVSPGVIGAATSSESESVDVGTDQGRAATPGGETRRSDSAGGSATGEYRRLDLNTATARELALLPGLGPKKAEAVIAWRREHGPFRTVDDLLEVKGIGRATLERLRPYASTGR